MYMIIIAVLCTVAKVSITIWCCIAEEEQTGQLRLSPPKTKQIRSKMMNVHVSDVHSHETEHSSRFTFAD